MMGPVIETAEAFRFRDWAKNLAMKFLRVGSDNSTVDH